MPPELVIGPVLIVVGLLLILFRRTVSRVFHRALERMYGEPLADDAMPPAKSPVRMLVVGLLFIAFGIVTLAGAFLA